MEMNDPDLNLLLWAVALSSFCNGLLWGGILWKIVPFPTWETIQRCVRRRKAERDNESTP